MSFWGELKRRNVFKVGAAYVIVAWLIVQVANTFFPILHLPEWIVTLVAFLLILGLPVALILAWAYEMTPEGVKLTKKVPLADSIAQVTGRKLNYILAGLLIVAVGYIIVLQFFVGKPAVQTEVASTVSEQTPPIVEVEDAPKTIAVLPFVNLSSDPEQEYFVDGLIEELLNSLAQIPDLNVTGRTSSFSFKGSNKTVQEIAEILGVENILEGSVRKAGNDLRITAQLLRGSDGFHLWSKTYDRKLEDIFRLQEDIATAVANELKVKLGIGQSFIQLGGTDNAEAYELYMIARGQWGRTESVTGYKRALKSIDAAIALDPEFAMAWALKSDIHMYLSVFEPFENTVAEHDASLSAALKAIGLEPDLAAGYCALGGIKLGMGEWIEAELAYKKALELKTEPLSGAEVTIGIYYLEIGYIKKALEVLGQMRQNDPVDITVLGWYITAFTFLGDIERTEEEYEHGRALFGDNWRPGTISNCRVGSGNIISSEEIVFSNPIHTAAKEFLESPKDGLAKLHQLYSNGDNLSSADFMLISLYAAYFGNPQFSMESFEKGFDMDASGLFTIWYPVMQDVRQLPRFKEFVREIGIVDYWEQFGWPDICRPLDDGNFTCD